MLMLALCYMLQVHSIYLSIYIVNNILTEKKSLYFLIKNINFLWDFPLSYNETAAAPSGCWWLCVHLNWTLNCPWSWTIKQWGIRWEGQRNSLTFRFHSLLAAMSVRSGGAGVMGLADWRVLARWQDSWFDGWKTTYCELPACHCSLRERVKPQLSFQHTLRPLIIIPAAVYSLPTQAKHRLDTALARGIPVCSNERWELLLCACSIWALVFHATPSLRKRICSLGADKINTSCSLEAE